MSAPERSSAFNHHAPVFAALGDPTRLAIVTRLQGGASLSITELTKGGEITRQGVTKHLRVLEEAGLVASARVGREHRYALTPEPLREAGTYLDEVAAHWEAALGRLKSFVEE